MSILRSLPPIQPRNGTSKRGCCSVCFASPQQLQLQAAWVAAAFGGHAKNHSCFADHDRLQRDDGDEAGRLRRAPHRAGKGGCVSLDWCWVTTDFKATSHSIFLCSKTPLLPIEPPGKPHSKGHLIDKIYIVPATSVLQNKVSVDGHNQDLWNGGFLI